MLPGSAGEYGVTAGHSPLISQLEPGVISVYLSGVSALCGFIIIFFIHCFDTMSLFANIIVIG